MGRSLKRQMARTKRIEEKKANPSVSINRDDVRQMKREITDKAVNNSIEFLMTCFALAMHHTEKVGRARCMRVLEECDRLMGEISRGEKTIAVMKTELKDYVGIRIML